MEIDVIREENVVKFCEVGMGKVFQYRGIYYLKTSRKIFNNEVVVNAVRLYGGELALFDDSMKVTEVNNARVVID